MLPKPVPEARTLRVQVWPSVPSLTCRRSRCGLRNWTPAPTCFHSEQCSTRWRPEPYRFVGKGLEKDRELRYQHAADMRADLKRLKRETESRHGAPTSSGSVPVAQESSSLTAAQPPVPESGLVPAAAPPVSSSGVK